MSKKIAIFGNGFVGKSFYDVLKNRDKDKKYFLIKRKFNPFNNDIVLEANKYDCVINTIGLHHDKSFIDLFLVNSLLNKKLSKAKTKKIINISSGLVYKINEYIKNKDERRAYCSLSKLLGEQDRFINLRCDNIFGEKMGSINSFIPNIIRDIKKNKNVVINSGFKRNFIDINSLAFLVDKIIDNKKINNGVFDVLGGKKQDILFFKNLSKNKVKIINHKDVINNKLRKNKSFIIEDGETLKEFVENNFNKLI